MLEMKDREHHHNMEHQETGKGKHHHPGGHSSEHHHEMMIADYRKRFLASLILTVPILLLSPLVQGFLGISLSFRGDNFFLLYLSSIVFFYGGFPFFKGFITEMRDRAPGMMTLITLAVGVSFYYSTLVVLGLPGKLFFWELATLIDIMLLGHWVEMRSVLGASRALQGLAELIPSTAHVVGKDGSIKDLPSASLKRGDLALVKPGEKVPADGTVTEGESRADESLLTGESAPVSKKKGSKVIGGSVNQEGALRITVDKAGEGSYVAQVISLVSQAQATRSKTQDFADRAAGWLAYTALTAGVLTLFAWLLLGRDFVFALERMVSVMVITCPHALGLAIPLVVAVSTSLAARNGLLIRDRKALERAVKLDAVVFDKTGTLTRAEFGVTNVLAEWEHKEEEILFYAASLESNSEHPIAAGILKKAKGKGVSIKSPDNFQALPGKGVAGKVGGKEIKVVGENYLREQGVEITSADVKKFSEQGKTIVYVLMEGKMMGVIALADLIREESREAVRRLKSMGIKCMMLTGDIKNVAAWVSQELELDEFFAGVLPSQKADVIKKIQEKGMRVAMVGDGINDAPALAAADVGIAIGAGTDIAIESAGIILTRSDPGDVVAVINLARATYAKMQQNLLWAAGYNIIAIPLAAGLLYNFGILLSPAVGALLMSASTVIVAINARFLSVKK